jgi:hypothetical protein
MCLAVIGAAIFAGMLRLLVLLLFTAVPLVLGLGCLMEYKKEIRKLEDFDLESETGSETRMKSIRIESREDFTSKRVTSQHWDSRMVKKRFFSNFLRYNIFLKNEDPKVLKGSKSQTLSLRLFTANSTPLKKLIHLETPTEDTLEKKEHAGNVLNSDSFPTQDFSGSTEMVFIQFWVVPSEGEGKKKLFRGSTKDK